MYATNSTLFGLSAYLQRQLQFVLNAAARLVFRLRRYDHITDAPAVLHWLRLPNHNGLTTKLQSWRSGNE